MKIQKLPQIFKAIIDKGIDVGFNLNKISYITDTPIKHNFTILMKKRIKLFVFTLQTVYIRKTLMNDFGTYSVKLSNDLKHITETFNWLQIDTFDFQS